MHYCSQEKETWALLFSGEINWCIHTGALLSSGEGNRRSTVLGKGDCQLISGERNWCTNVIRKGEARARGWG